MQVMSMILVVLGLMTMVPGGWAFAREKRARMVLGSLAALTLAATLVLGSSLLFFRPSLCESLGGRWHEPGTNCTGEWGERAD